MKIGHLEFQQDLRSVRGRVEVCGADVGTIADRGCESNGDSTLGLGTGDSRRNPGEDKLEDRKRSSGLQKHGLGWLDFFRVTTDL